MYSLRLSSATTADLFSTNVMMKRPLSRSSNLSIEWRVSGTTGGGDGALMEVEGVLFYDVLQWTKPNIVSQETTISDPMRETIVPCNGDKNPRPHPMHEQDQGPTHTDATSTTTKGGGGKSVGQRRSVVVREQGLHGGDEMILFNSSINGMKATTHRGNDHTLFRGSDTQMDHGAQWDHPCRKWWGCCDSLR